MNTDWIHNQQRAEQFLARFKQRPLGHFINGKHHINAATPDFDNFTPADNSLLGQVNVGDSDDIHLAATAARNAFPTWRDLPGKERAQLLLKIADAIVKHQDQIALIESMDTGQPIRFMSKAALRGAENFRFFANRAEEARNGLSLPADAHMNYTLRQPIGPVGVITPWNTPFMLSTWKIAPALASGCTVVHKPAEWSPLSAMLLAEICQEAGLPDGVLNLVNGYGEQAGKALTEHPDIKAIAFIGESSTGSAIMAQGAATLKRVHFELGGKNPVVVFADADLERALDAVVFMIYSLNGERCTSSSRVLIEKSIEAEFLSRLEQRVKKIRVGHPLDPATEVGPLIHRRHFDKVCSYFDIAEADGARILAGGAAFDAAALSSENAPDSTASNTPGNYVQPTLFAAATSTMRIAQEEIFGPVLTSITFETEAEALKIANDVRYGLAGYLWTNDVARAHRFAHAMEAGMVWINSENNRHLPSPFGGMKASGIGRDGGDYSFDFYMETKNICIAMQNHHIPKLGI